MSRAPVGITELWHPTKDSPANDAIRNLMERHEQRLARARKQWQHTMDLIHSAMAKRRRVIGERIGTWELESSETS